VYLNAAAIAEPTAQILAAVNVTYALDVAPFTQYRSDGATLVVVPQYTLDASDNITGLVGGAFLDGDSTLLFDTQFVSGVPVSITNTTAQTVLSTLTIPADAIRANSTIEILAMWSENASANTKTPSILLNDGGGGSAGADIIYNAGAGNQLAYVTLTTIFIGSNVNQQKSGLVNSFPGVGAVTSSLQYSSKSAAAGLDIVFVGTLTVATDTITLEGYRVTVKS
jgi:hypothetical protein